MLRRFSCSGDRTWPCLLLSSQVLLLTRDVSPHNYQPVRSFAFADLSTRHFASLRVSYSLIDTHSFLGYAVVVVTKVKPEVGSASHKSSIASPKKIIAPQAQV